MVPTIYAIYTPLMIAMCFIFPVLHPTVPDYVATTFVMFVSHAMLYVIELLTGKVVSGVTEPFVISLAPGASSFRLILKLLAMRDAGESLEEIKGVSALFELVVKGVSYALGVFLAFELIQPTIKRRVDYWAASEALAPRHARADSSMPVGQAQELDEEESVEYRYL